MGLRLGQKRNKYVKIVNARIYEIIQRDDYNSFTSTSVR